MGWLRLGTSEQGRLTACKGRTGRERDRIFFAREGKWDAQPLHLLFF